MEIKTTLRVLMYGGDTKSSRTDGFAIAKFICNEHIKKDETDLFGKEFVAKGNCLPTAVGQKFTLSGDWAVDKQGREAFSVVASEEMVEKNQAGIVAYLQTLKGIGAITAYKIYEQYGDDTLEVLDSDPTRISELGFSEKKTKEIIDGYTSQRGAKDVLNALVPLGISANKALKVYQKLKGDAMDVITNHPYRLCSSGCGITFATIETIAKAKGLSMTSAERIEAGVYNVLLQAESGGPCFGASTGHLCVDIKELITKASEFLKVSEAMVLEAIKSLGAQGRCIVQKNPETGATVVYRAYTAQAEYETVQNIKRLLDEEFKVSFDMENEIRKFELSVDLRLAPEQAQAIRTSLRNRFSIVTGGPGTGKTTVINGIRTIFEWNNPGKKILLCAPTGRASRRMSESTGYPACTIHKALNFIPTEEAVEEEPTCNELDYDLIVVDEISMLDVFLARAFLKAVKKGCQVVLIGDPDQLPSVGPGAVLADMLSSGVLPVAKLIKVYRQAGNSKVATNAALMRRGITTFDYSNQNGNEYVFYEKRDWESAAAEMERIFLEMVARDGIDNVTMLSPMRKANVATSTEQLNARVRDKVNPPSEHKAELKAHGKVFRVGDKVMQTRNTIEVSNGDIGYITSIEGSGKDARVVIDFEGRIAEYDFSEMESIIWAYATTIHKSQGSEYQTVIINIMDGHTVMLKRNLIYTAITRAKKNCHIVGCVTAQMKAVRSACGTEDIRHTMMAERLRAAIKK